MSKLVPDLTGERFGMLVVTHRVSGHRYHCTCDCGEATIRSAYTLRRKTRPVKSCGCQVGKHVSPQRKAPGECAKAASIYAYRRNARKRGLEFTLTDEQAISVMAQDCHYCGIPPSNFRKVKDAAGTFAYNGLDRVDNAMGYADGNVVPCCWRCNLGKGDGSALEYVERCRRVAERFPG